MSYKSKNLYPQCHYVLITELSESDGSPTKSSPPLSPGATPHSISSMEDSRPAEENSQTGQGKMQREGKDPLMWRLEGAQGKGRVPGTGKEVRDPPAPTAGFTSKDPLRQSILLCFEE